MSVTTPASPYAREMLTVSILALVFSVVALAVTAALAVRQLRLSRQANSLPVLVDMFREHRGRRLRKARSFVFNELDNFDLTKGLAGLPDAKRKLVTDLAFFYDNLGALVAYQIVAPGPVVGYLGGSVRVIYQKMRPLIEAERQLRQAWVDSERWQVYFENLDAIVEQHDFAAERASLRMWRLR